MADATGRVEVLLTVASLAKLLPAPLTSQPASAAPAASFSSVAAWCNTLIYLEGGTMFAELYRCF